MSERDQATPRPAEQPRDDGAEHSAGVSGKVPPLPTGAADPTAAPPVPPRGRNKAPSPAPRRTFRWTGFHRREAASFVTSVVFHATLLVALALMVEAGRSMGPFRGFTMSPSRPVELDSTEPVALVNKTAVLRSRVEGHTEVVPLELSDPRIEPLAQGDSRPDGPTRSYPLGIDPNMLWRESGSGTGGGLEGRLAGARSKLALSRGGTRESEAAVERGLRWLAAQQHADGSWTFFHPKEMTRPAYRDPGTEPSTTAATAMAIMAFLGAGYTHTEGEHQGTVAEGLYYLSNRAIMRPEGADLREGTMYAQGLSAIALCEAYAMTHDPALKGLAQRAIDFIVYAQDKKGGGWRYTPGEPGDTTVTGWQLMALKSAQMAGLHVPSPVMPMADRFLDGVASEYGAKYGYLTPEPRRTTTAIGLLCRMYLGWGRDEAGLERGAGLLDQWKPSPTDMYFNYYATQVMNHWQGRRWEKWNRAMRDYLVHAQSSEGLESGSWFFVDEKCASGGRLYNTSMAIMTLEVYYRYMPLYESLPLDEEK
ncbi:MAG: hypothetical protein JW888_08905 [Pirellulales bacterium]|nr:hypothetical protein [Pirellulales bacterium]